MPRFGPLRIVFAALVCLTLGVGAHAVWTEYAAFPPHFRGFGEVTPRGEVAGWAVNSAEPAARVEVQLYVDGRFIAYGVASLARPDVKAAGRSADENCGYRFTLAPLAEGEHEARIYAMHAGDAGELRTLQQLGNTLHFKTGADGRLLSRVVAPLR
ncbi:MAG: hypothetical protein QOJ70_1642 [Acidobacteriota bacterium]|jgi:hypothetical protein|nr:hypothetical protein [Acidobacteriota bacterium]